MLFYWTEYTPRVVVLLDWVHTKSCCPIGLNKHQELLSYWTEYTPRVVVLLNWVHTKSCPIGLITHKELLSYWTEYTPRVVVLLDWVSTKSCCPIGLSTHQELLSYWTEYTLRVVVLLDWVQNYTLNYLKNLKMLHDIISLLFLHIHLIRECSCLWQNIWLKQTPYHHLTWPVCSIRI